jgi:translation initiation factor 5B
MNKEDAPEKTEAPVAAKAEKKAEAAAKKEESSEDDAVDDWENADLDEIADKIKLNKDITVAVPDDEDNQQVLENNEAQESKKTKGPSN